MKKKILLVDDDAMLMSAVKRILEDTGKYEVRTEGRADKGLELALSFRPDLVILDVIMPNVDGGTVANQLLDDPRTKNVPVLFLTSTVTDEKVRDHGGRIAGRPFVAKPVDSRTLIRRIEECLGAPPSR